MPLEEERRFRAKKRREERERAERAEAARRTVYRASRIVRESVPLLAVVMLLQIAAGQILHNQSSVLFDAPFLLLLVPAMNGVGGNIGSVLGARLASGLHLGTIPASLRGPTLWMNVRTTLALAAITYLALAFAVDVVARMAGIPIALTPLNLLLLVVGAGFLLTFALTLITVATAFLSFRRGFDPDNHVIPTVTASGDFLGVVALFTVYGVIL